MRASSQRADLTSKTSPAGGSVYTYRTHILPAAPRADTVCTVLYITFDLHAKHFTYLGLAFYNLGVYKATYPHRRMEVADGDANHDGLLVYHLLSSLR